MSCSTNGEFYGIYFYVTTDVYIYIYTCAGVSDDKEFGINLSQSRGKDLCYFKVQTNGTDGYPSAYINDVFVCVYIL